MFKPSLHCTVSSTSSLFHITSRNVHSGLAGRHQQSVTLTSSGKMRVNCRDGMDRHT